MIFIFLNGRYRQHILLYGHFMVLGISVRLYFD